MLTCGVIVLTFFQVSTDTIEKTAPAVVESEPFTQLFADEEPGVVSHYLIRLP